MWRSGCGEEIDDVLDGFVGAVVGEFQTAVRRMLGVRPVVEAAVGERSAQALVKEQEKQCDLGAFWGQAIGVARAVALDQCMSFELAQIIAQLVEAVGIHRKIEGGEDGLVDVAGGPAADLRAGVQENLEEADDPRVVEFDAGVADRADCNGEGDLLQQRKVGVDVEPLGLETGEPGDDAVEFVADLVEMIEPLFQTEVVEVVGAQLVAQVHRELLVLPENCIAEVGAEHMMTVFDLVDDGGKVAPVVAPQAHAKDLGDLVRGQSPQAELTASLEELVDGKVALEDKIEAVLDLADRVGAR